MVTHIKVKRVIEFYVMMQRKIQLLVIILYGSPCRAVQNNILDAFQRDVRFKGLYPCFHSKTLFTSCVNAGTSHWSR